MIITRIVGGLGNQMFQYAVGRALSLASGQPLKLDLTDMDRDRLRSLQLDQFNIKGDIASLDEVPAKQRNSMFGRIMTSVKNRSRVPQRVEKSAQFDPTILLIREPVHLTGYWQTEKYFADYADIIRQDFSLKQPFSAQRQNTLRMIEEAQSPVSVHVRRGDYVSNPSANSIHGTCEPEWYAKAMHTMGSTMKDATFFVFSDDPQWARENLATLGKMIFIEPQSDGRDGEDMHLMAACHSHIVANSTFSWWGAWLNPRERKRVIAPASWFRSQAHDNPDLVPSSWERLTT